MSVILGTIGVLLTGMVVKGMVKDAAKFLQEGKYQEAVLAQAKADKISTQAAEKKMVGWLMAERNRDREFKENIQPQRERENMMLGYALQGLNQPSQVPEIIMGASNQFAASTQRHTPPIPPPPQMSVANLMSF